MNKTPEWMQALPEGDEAGQFVGLAIVYTEEQMIAYGHACGAAAERAERAQAAMATGTAGWLLPLPTNGLLCSYKGANVTLFSADQMRGKADAIENISCASVNDNGSVLALLREIEVLAPAGSLVQYKARAAIAAIQPKATAPAQDPSAGDRVDAVDAQRYRYIRDTATLDNAVWEALEGYGLTNEAGELMEDEYRAGMDRAIDRAILQSQKGGSHGAR